MSLSRKFRKMICVCKEEVDIGYKASFSPPLKRVINEEARQSHRSESRKFRKMLCVCKEEVDTGYKGSLSPPFKRVNIEKARQ